jgi:hypothetical protein
MNIRLVFVLKSCTLFCNTALSQIDLNHDLSVETKSEQMISSSGDDELDLSSFLDNIQELKENPINLNKAGYDELYSTGLFSDIQILLLLDHRERFGKLITIPELLVVSNFDVDYIRIITPYITTGVDIDEPNASFGRMLKDGKHSVILRSSITAENRRGYIDEGYGPKYAGDPFGYMLKYKFSFMKKLSFGFVAEKDPGELFGFKKGGSGFDFYSGNLTVRNLGSIKALVLGDFQLGYGQGLVINGSFGGASASDPLSVNSSAQGIRPYSSTGESFFKRGIAFSLKRKVITVDGFCSYRKLDANILSDDSTNWQSGFSSLLTSGLHRTESEINDRNALSELFYGGNVRYRKRGVRIGFTGFSSKFSLPLTRDLQSYNQFEFRGKSLFSIGVDYSYHYRNINLFGETASDRNGNLATINGIIISADSKFAFSFLHRYYPIYYQNIYAGSFGKSSKTMNETGLYTGISIKPSKSWNLTLSLDQFRFPWLKYQIDAPSFGQDLSFQFNYLPSRNTQLYFRFNSRLGSVSSDESPYFTSSTRVSRHQGFRLHMASKVSKTFTVKTRVEMIRYKEGSELSNGLAIYQDINYHPMNSKWKVNLRYVIIDTDDYDSRIYAYENDVLYSYSMTSYSDAGSRLIFNLRYKISRSVDLWFRYAASFYDERESVGSGWDEIEGSRKSDLKLQLRFEF